MVARGVGRGPDAGGEGRIVTDLERIEAKLDRVLALLDGAPQDSPRKPVRTPHVPDGVPPMYGATALADAYVVGRKAGRDDGAVRENPYAYDDTRHNAWLDGFRDGRTERVHGLKRTKLPSQRQPGRMSASGRAARRDGHARALDRARDAGRQARRAGEPRKSCPYASYRGGYQGAWLSGWDGAGPRGAA